MTTSRKEIFEMRTDRGAAPLCRMARDLGYRGAVDQLYNDDGSAVSDLLAFFKDNPGAVEAVRDWVLEEGRDADGEELEGDEEDDDTYLGDDEVPEIELKGAAVGDTGLSFMVFVDGEEYGPGELHETGELSGSGRWFADEDMRQMVLENAEDEAAKLGFKYTKDDANEFASRVMQRLGPAADREAGYIRQVAREFYRDGYSDADAVDYCKCLEEVNPALDEDEALRRMAKVKERPHTPRT